MGRVLNIELTPGQQLELEKAYKESGSHVLRQRCQIVLLKASGRKTSDICEIVGLKSENQANKWARRYRDEYPTLGIDSLRNAKGQGRKAIFDVETEAEIIQQVVRNERQKLENAKAILENRLGRSFNIKTLKNFLKALAGDINA